MGTGDRSLRPEAYSFLHRCLVARYACGRKNMKRVLGIWILLTALTLLPAAGAIGSGPPDYDGYISDGGDFVFGADGEPSGLGDEGDPGQLPGDPDDMTDGEHSYGGVNGDGDVSEALRVRDVALWEQLMQWLLQALVVAR